MQLRHLSGVCCVTLHCFMLYLCTDVTQVSAVCSSTMDITHHLAASGCATLAAAASVSAVPELPPQCVFVVAKYGLLCCPAQVSQGPLSNGTHKQTFNYSTVTFSTGWLSTPFSKYIKHRGSRAVKVTTGVQRGHR